MTAKEAREIVIKRNLEQNIDPILTRIRYEAENGGLKLRLMTDELTISGIKKLEKLGYKVESLEKQQFSNYLYSEISW